jgi:16S rRNA G966 N2-methylase RsmD
VILADPPYDVAAHAALVAGVDSGRLLGLHGSLVVERESRNPAPSSDLGLRLVRTAEYGRTALDFFKY